MNTSFSGLLLQAFASHNGKLSSTRVQSSAVTLIIMGVWAYLSIHKAELLPLPEYLAFLVIGGIGLTAYRSAKEPAHPHTQEKKESPNA